MKPRALILLSLLPLAACVDVRSFAGGWTGAIVPDDPVLQGFARDARVEQLTLSDVDLRGITATLTTDAADGRFHDTRLTPVPKFASDAIATLTFDGSPIRSYLLFATLASDPQGPPAYELVSFFSDDHVELRVIRGDDLYGVFQLGRIAQ